ncbi:MULTISPECIES: HlyD family efflux transporter periplasmic adaptor subunit [unclassified Streptomyces]|uniref:HlyD family efflux transporter periplasmic adaptor subunit n=1 Tax=unclassified Streptomyces TaxID=2593676 RepID=UPI002DDA5C52|nr:HlyD family efflux transporter periplasmic adaptor subunit [Streptomyces sp. NBC_01775]WSB80481.1 HlyD family efflux transporter periplasmic adaptor subunit [Streptomyces sp. NBC_01775]WSS40022.1 HlyD family efflux transporter periplasmic adaptor subunit [Streptomyces sp. NBC_01187]
MEFRQKALGKLQSPEELDVPVRFARPQGLLVLVVTIVVMAAGCVWAVTGTVSSKLAAPGVLTHTQGSYLLQSPVPGQVTAVHAKAGQSVEKGAPVVSVRTDQGVRPVRAVARGRVTSLAAEVGAVVTTGADVATVERVRSADDPLVAMLYIPADKGATVPVGATVDLTVGSVPADRYGMLRGTVQSVGQSPQTRQQISGFLGDKDLAQQFTRRGRPLAVLVRLKRAPATKSGYAWSRDGGPPSAPESATPVRGAAHLTAQRPVDWLLP